MVLAQPFLSGQMASIGRFGSGPDAIDPIDAKVHGNWNPRPDCEGLDHRLPGRRIKGGDLADNIDRRAVRCGNAIRQLDAPRTQFADRGFAERLAGSRGKLHEGPTPTIATVEPNGPLGSAPYDAVLVVRSKCPRRRGGGSGPRRGHQARSEHGLSDSSSHGLIFSFFDLLEPKPGLRVLDAQRTSPAQPGLSTVRLSWGTMCHVNLRRKQGQLVIQPSLALWVYGPGRVMPKIG